MEPVEINGTKYESYEKYEEIEEYNQWLNSLTEEQFLLMDPMPSTNAGLQRLWITLAEDQDSKNNIFITTAEYADFKSIKKSWLKNLTMHDYVAAIYICTLLEWQMNLIIKDTPFEELKNLPQEMTCIVDVLQELTRMEHPHYKEYYLAVEERMKRNNISETFNVYNAKLLVCKYVHEKIIDFKKSNPQSNPKSTFSSWLKSIF